MDQDNDLGGGFILIVIGALYAAGFLGALLIGALELLRTMPPS